jgi:hypothetical protein
MPHSDFRRVSPPLGRHSLANPSPFLALLGEFRDHGKTYAAISPQSDVAQCLEYVCKRLEHAIEESQDANVWLTVSQVVQLVNRPESTIRALCSSHGADAGARKQKGAWTIHWPTFESFWSNSTR